MSILGRLLLLALLACSAYHVGANVPEPASTSNSACLEVGIAPVSSGTFAFNKDRCTTVQLLLSIYLSGQGWFGQLYGNFYLNGAITSGFDRVTECSATRVRSCGTLGDSESAVSDMAEYIGGLGPQILREMLLNPDGSCPPDLLGDIIYLRSLAPDGQDDELGIDTGLSTCRPNAPRFPFGCRCERAEFSSPFYLNTHVNSVETENGTSIYCFDVRVAAFMANDWTSACGQATVVRKVEFWADHSKRKSLVGAFLAEVDPDTTRKVPVTWGPPSDNTLRITGLNWTMAAVDSRQPSVCLELRNNTPLNQFCLSETGHSAICTVSIVDATRKCCPVYEATEY